MTQIQHIENGESMSNARTKINNAIDSVNNFSSSGITIPELILKPRLIGYTAQYALDNSLYICCKFPENAEFLQHNPKIYLYRRVFHSKYNRTAKNKYPNAPLKMVRDKEKLFSHPAHLYPNNQGEIIYSEFPFGNAAAIRFNNTYIFPLRIESTAVNYAARFFASQFGSVSTDLISLNRCSRKHLSVNRTIAGRISVRAGFKLVTDVGESSMATCKVRVTSRYDENINNYILITSFEAM